MFSLKPPHRGDSNEYTQCSTFIINKKITLNYPTYAAVGLFSKGHKNDFEPAVAIVPSVLEPLKVFCTDLCGWVAGEENKTPDKRA